MQNQKSLFKLFVNCALPASRAVQIFCKLSNYEFDLQKINIHKGEHKRPDFAKINPLKSVPCVQDGEFTVGEAPAMMKYLVRKLNTIDSKNSMYPVENLQQSLKIDEFIDWFSCTLKPFLALWIFNEALAPVMKQKPVDGWENFKVKSQEGLKVLNDLFLNEKQWVAGSEMSIADLLAYQEIVQLKMCQIDLKTDYPNIAKWFDEISKNSVVQEINQEFYSFVQTKNINQ